MSDFFAFMEYFKNENRILTSEDEIPEPVATRFMESLIKDLTKEAQHEYTEEE